MCPNSEFVKVEAFPLVGEIGVENYQQYYSRGLDFVWVFIDYSDDKQTALIKDVVEPVAADHKGKVRSQQRVLSRALVTIGRYNSFPS